MTDAEIAALAERTAVAVRESSSSSEERWIIADAIREALASQPQPAQGDAKMPAARLALYRKIAAQDWDGMSSEESEQWGHMPHSLIARELVAYIDRLTADLHVAIGHIHDLQQESAAYQRGKEDERREIVNLIDALPGTPRPRSNRPPLLNPGERAVLEWVVQVLNPGERAVLEWVVQDIKARGAPGPALPPDQLRERLARLVEAARPLVELGRHLTGEDDDSSNLIPDVGDFRRLAAALEEAEKL